MLKKVKTVLVDTLPPRIEMKENIIYVSEKTLNATHLDFYGSGEEIMTPFVRGGYHYYLNSDDEVSISPQVQTESNQSYYIKDGFAFSAV